MRTDSPLLLVVSELPASGKTFLSRYGSGACPWSPGTRTRRSCTGTGPISRTLAQAGPVGFSLLWQVTGVVLAAGSSVVLESHFSRPMSEGHIRELATSHRARLAQVFCEAPLPELSQRHALRAASGKRPRIDLPFKHEELPVEACWHPLDLGAPLLQVDTTHPEARDVALAWAHQHVGSSPRAQQKEETP